MLGFVTDVESFASIGCISSVTIDESEGVYKMITDQFYCVSNQFGDDMLSLIEPYKFD